MGILTRPLLRPQQRWDLEDFNVALSALRADSHFHVQRFLSDKSYIMQGFTIDSSFIGQPTADLSLVNATLINGDNTGDVSWWTAPATPTPITLPTGVGGLQAGRNYVELEVYALAGTPLQRAFWDPSANSGQGLEFTQEVNTVTEMFVRVVINQTGFTTGNPNLIKLAFIDLDGSLNIKGIKDERDLFYRLGNPDNIDDGFIWSTRTEPGILLTFGTPSGTAFTVGETITFTSGATATVQVGGTNNIQVFDFSTNTFEPGDAVSGGTSGASATLQSYYESFVGADKDIRNMRDTLEALMTEIKILKGTRFWYELGGTVSLPTLLNLVNSFIVPVSNGAKFSWDGTALKISDNATSGQATSDVIAAIRRAGFGGDLLLTREDGTGGSAPISIADGSVLYVQLPAAGASRTYSESGPGVSNFQVIDIASFIPTENNFIIAYRESAKLVFPGSGDLAAGEETDIGEGVSKEILAYIGAATQTSTNPQYTSTPSANLSNQFSSSDSLTAAIGINAANINDISSALLKPYEEILNVVVGTPSSDNEVQGPLTTGQTITLPLDSRNSNVQKKYKVGQGGLIIFLNGQHLTVGVDYLEVGSTGSLSQTVQLMQGLVVNDSLDIRIINPQFFGTAGDDQPFFVNYIVGQNGAGIPVGALYNLATDRLQIWRNGLMMLKTTSLGDVIDRYQETTTNAVTVAQTANPSELFVMVNHAAPNPNTTILTGLTGTVITVPSYTPGNKALRIFRNGILLTLNATADASLKYTESSGTTITLSLAAGTTDVFKVYRAGAAPTWRESINGVSGSTVTIPNSQTFTPSNQHMLVFRNGLLMANSTTVGTASERYQESSNNAVALEVAAVTADHFEFLYI